MLEVKKVNDASLATCIRRILISITRTTHEDTDPLITFRGHTLGVTKVEVSAEQGRVYSSSLDSTIRIWKLPPLDRTPYAPVGTLSTFTVDMSEDTV
jgi:WD40 repeat protein